jgi:hypothetical protein
LMGSSSTVEKKKTRTGTGRWSTASCSHGEEVRKRKLLLHASARPVARRSVVLHVV